MRLSRNFEYAVAMVVRTLFALSVIGWNATQPQRMVPIGNSADTTEIARSLLAGSSCSEAGVDIVKYPAKTRKQGDSTDARYAIPTQIRSLESGGSTMNSAETNGFAR